MTTGIFTYRNYDRPSTNTEKRITAENPEELKKKAEDIFKPLRLLYAGERATCVLSIISEEIILKDCM